MGLTESSVQQIGQDDWLQARLFVIGLDDAGKSALLQRMTIGRVLEDIKPTHSYVEDTIIYRDVRFNIKDIDGKADTRYVWRHHFAGLDGVMFVVDSANHSRLEEAIQEFNKILPEDNLKDVPILIVANKQDLPEALETQEIWKQFKIAEIKQPVAVLSTSAITGVGVHEAFDWFVNRIKRKIQEQDEEEEY